MIRFRALSDERGLYYLDDPAPEVADLLDDRGVGVWMGALAAQAGLRGSVESGALATVLSGRLPGGTIVPSTRRSRSAYDLIFAATKPVSVLFASDDDRVATVVVESHRRAVEGALGYLEARGAVLSRHQEGDRSAVATDGVIGAAFTHGSSRSGDPHLHTHLVIANMAHGRDGRFGPLDSRALHLQLRSADALYRAQVRVELRRRLGVVWQVADGAERLAQVRDAEIVALSGRGAERRAGERAVPAKSGFTSRDQAQHVWHARLQAAPVLDDLERRTPVDDRLDEHRFAGRLHATMIRGRDLVEAFADAAPAGVDASLVATVLRRSSADLGLAGFERALAPRAVLPSPRTLGHLGPRPTGRDALESWWRRAASLERSEQRAQATEIERSRGAGLAR